VSLTVTDSTGQTSTVTQEAFVEPVHASLTYPTAGQNVNTATSFSWSDIPAGQDYQLWIGTSRGHWSLLKSGLLKASTSSYQLPALPAGKTLWARIYTGVASGWGNWQDVSFTTATTDASTDKALETASRRAAIDRLTALAAQQPTPAWMRQLLRLEPNLHPSARTRPLNPAHHTHPLTPASGRRHSDRVPEADAPALARPRTHRSRVARLHNRSARESTVMPAGVPLPVSRVRIWGRLGPESAAVAGFRFRRDGASSSSRVEAPAWVG
jgi:hypothetical protein